jgi:hypothetical protein
VGLARGISSALSPKPHPARMQQCMELR